MLLVVIGIMVLGKKSASASAAPPEATNFQCDISLQYAGMSLGGSISRPGPGHCTITLNDPESLKGLCFDIADGEIDISYGGLKLPIGSLDIPESNIMQPLCKALDTAASIENLQIDRRDGNYVFYGPSTLSDFELLCSGDGRILKLALSKYELDIDFDNYKS